MAEVVAEVKDEEGVVAVEVVEEDVDEDVDVDVDVGDEDAGAGVVEEVPV